jgi:AcrR family transcriptional regulator
VAVTERSLAERKREVVRLVLATAAAELLRDREYDSITIDEIARLAGVSRRTFFRYYPTKEDVFLAMYAEYGQDILDRLAARPAGDAPAWALRRAFYVTDPTPDREQVFELVKMTVSVPALHARHLEHLAMWRRSLAEVLAARCGLDPKTDLRPELAVAIALAALDTALGRWVESGDAFAIDAIIGACFDLVEDTINTMLTSNGSPRRGQVAASQLA